MRFFRCLVLLLVTAIPGLYAQGAPSQDSTLTGIRTVDLRLIAPTDNETLRSALALELRKAGLRVVPETALPNPTADAVIYVLLRESGNCAKELRLSVIQRAQIVRTGQVHQLVTWYHEIPASGIRGGNPCRREWWSDAVRDASDAFLNKWLAANGR